ncbi:MAG: S-layer homology domain-containing protein, partial [Bacillota bacterium]|nr:S-layer homology domain-containing protein [Bacillota bacterium]
LSAIMKVSGTLDGTSDNSYKIVKEPKLGKAAIDPGSNVFEYSAPDKKTGTDSFEYQSLDSKGNVLSTGKVNVKVEKPSSTVTFADMTDCYANYAAVKLTEAGVLSGTELAGNKFFHPTNTVNRGEFLAMLMTALEEDGDVSTVSNTGLADDKETPKWLKGFIKKSVDKGIASGKTDKKDSTASFAPNDTITRAEAAVMVNNALAVKLPSEVGLTYTDSESIPTWAYTAVSTLTNIKVMNGDNDNRVDPCGQLTRAEAAQLIYNAVKYKDSTNSSAYNVFSWFK